MSLTGWRGAAIPAACRSTKSDPAAFPGSPCEKGRRAPGQVRAVLAVVWADSHCHVQYDGVGLAAVAAAAESGVARVVTIGTDVARSLDAIDVVRRGRADGLALWATAGVHPHEAGHGLAGLADLLGEPEVVAVGECGLDYYYEHSPRDAQLAAFEAQVELARSADLALVIHTRDAWDDTFAVLGRGRRPGAHR